MLWIRTLGRLALTKSGSDEGVPPIQRRRLALLALLVSAGDRGVTRDKVVAYLWPESDTDSASNNLRQALFTLRRDLGADILVAGHDIRLDPTRIGSDLSSFEAALAESRLGDAVAVYGGPFLDGFHVSEAPEFERWVDDERARLAGTLTSVLESLATQNEADGNAAAAINWWRRLAAHEPLDARVAIALMRTLASAGDASGAIVHGRLHEQAVRRELGTSIAPPVRAMIDRLSMGADVCESSNPHRRNAVARSASVDRARTPSPPQGEALSEQLTIARLRGSQFPDSAPRDEIVARHAAWTRRRRTWLVGGAVVAVAATALAAGALRARDTRQGHERVGSVIAIAPFSVAGADSSLSFWAEGAVDLLAAALSDGAETRAIAGSHDDTRLSGESKVQAALRTARDRGANRLVTGVIVGEGDHVSINATVYSVPSGGEKQFARASGLRDSLPMLMDRVAAQVIAREAGENESRLSNLSQTSLPALKEYLAGQAAYRRGQYWVASERFRIALRLDSTFALAGLRLALSSGWADRPSTEHDWALSLAWAARDRLIERDRVFLEVFAAGRIPQARTVLVAGETRWDRALRAVPDWPEVWYEYADMLFHEGGARDRPNFRQQASAAFRRALSIDPNFAPAFPHLLQLDVIAGDTASVRALGRRYLAIDSVSAAAHFVRWQMANALNDKPGVHGIRARFDSIPPRTLRWIAMTGEFDGFAMADAGMAAAALGRLAGSDAERVQALQLQHDVAMNRGRPLEALAAAEELGSVRPRSREYLRMEVLDALYAGGEAAPARQAAARLAEFADAPPAVTEDERLDQYRDICVVAQWRLAMGDRRSSARAGAALRAAQVRRGSLPESAQAIFRTCGMLLEAQIASAEGRTSAAALVDSLDAFVRTAPGLSEMLSYISLAVARLNERHLGATRALVAIRRRFYFAFDAPYSAVHAREEGRLSVLAGDRLSGARAYARYLAMRADPEPSQLREAANVRMALSDVTRTPAHDGGVHDTNSSVARVDRRTVDAAVRVP